MKVKILPNNEKASNKIEVGSLVRNENKYIGLVIDIDPNYDDNPYINRKSEHIQVIVLDPAAKFINVVVWITSCCKLFDGQVTIEN